MSKMIGIRIPADSDLSDRLKKLGMRLRKSHGELLEMWIRETENRKDLFGGNIFSPEDAPNESATNELAELRVQVNELVERVAALESRAPDRSEHTPHVDGNTTTAEPTEEPPLCKDTPNATVTPEFSEPSSPDASDTPENSAPVSPDAGTENEAVARILELTAEGLSTRKIAVRLNADRVPTLTGGSSWNHGAVAKILKQHKKE